MQEHTPKKFRSDKEAHAMRILMNDADKIHMAETSEQIPLRNIAALIAKAELEQKGYYAYRQDGQKHLIVMV